MLNYKNLIVVWKFRTLTSDDFGLGYHNVRFEQGIYVLFLVLDSVEVSVSFPIQICAHRLTEATASQGCGIEQFNWTRNVSLRYTLSDHNFFTEECKRRELFRL